jgi:ABC-type phosphate transport system substrate-binding protein
MKTTSQKLLTLLLLLAALLSHGIASAEIAVIVPADSHAVYDDLTIEKIFLVQVYTLPDGSKAQPVHQKDGNPIHSDFMLGLLNKAPSFIRSGWSKLTFTGAMKPIKELPDDESVIKFVESTPNAIGYVNASKVKGNVRVIMKF